MKIAVVSDALYPVHETVSNWLMHHGHTPVLFGALQTGQEVSWVKAAEEAMQSILQGDCDEGIFFCWTGTGMSMAANKFKGIRAALCTDAQTAKGARIWNHANVLVLSNRLLSQDLAGEILEAWFEGYDRQKGEEEVRELLMLEG